MTPVIEVDAATMYQQDYQQVVFVVAHWSKGKNTYSTGVLVGANDILTATHVVYHPDRGGWAERFDFYFLADYNGETEIMEKHGAHIIGTTGEDIHIMAFPGKTYSDGDNLSLQSFETQYDIAVIGLKHRIGDTLGWLKVEASDVSYSRAKAIGYPIGNTGMMEQTLTVTKSKNYGTYSTHHNAMSYGSSGGPLIINHKVVGIKSAGKGSHGRWADVGFTIKDIKRAIKKNNQLIE